VNTHVIKLGPHRPKAGFDIPQALAIGQLRKSHHPEMLGAPEGLDLVVALIVIDKGLKPPPWKLLHQLRKNRCSGIHRSPSVKGSDHKPKPDSSRQGSVLFATNSF